MHVYSVMFTRIGSGAEEEGAEKVADLKPRLFEELSADNGLISPSHAICSFSDIRALGQRSSAHWQVRLECVKAQSLQSKGMISIWQNPLIECECGPNVKSTLLHCYTINKGGHSVSGMQLSKIHRAKLRFAERLCLQKYFSVFVCAYKTADIPFM